MNGKFKIIYADPPWPYNSGKSKNPKIWGLAQTKYNIMSLNAIKNYPVKHLADNNSICFLWATFPLLKDAIEVLEAWGFKYKTVGFVWVKQNKKGTDIKKYGLGWYTRSNCEIVLIGRRGKFERQSKSVQQVILSPLKEHSEKPDEVRDRIVKLCGDIPRVELFARKKSKGWESIGDQL